MNAESIVTVSAAVVALVQLVKWAGLREHYGPLAVIGFSLVGVAVWVVSGEAWPPTRTDIWSIFSGAVAVATSAAGVFGFTRAAVGAVTRATPPPSGPGEQTTVVIGGNTISEADLKHLADEIERRRRLRIQAVRMAGRTTPEPPPAPADTDFHRDTGGW